jgi:ankyrin repeat protein
VNVRNKMDASALHSALSNGCYEIAQLLLDHGADAAAANASGETARDLAVNRGYPR